MRLISRNRDFGIMDEPTLRNTKYAIINIPYCVFRVFMKQGWA
jgi:hypothetical protein